ncbi:MAG: hypothetical protein ACREPZ_08625, partial [Rhodanobacteraceae bacterium]
DDSGHAATSPRVGRTARQLARNDEGTIIALRGSPYRNHMPAYPGHMPFIANRFRINRVGKHEIMRCTAGRAKSAKASRATLVRGMP